VIYVGCCASFLRLKMMDVHEAIETRKSVRAYESKPVPNDALMRVLEAAHLAPSASNLQPWHFVVVTDAEKRKKLSEGRFASFLVEAPVVIVGCGDPKTSPRWYMVDVAIALENIVLAATSEGLGTCWVGSFDEEKVKQMLKIPEDYRIVALLTVGYSRERGDLTRKLAYLVKRRKDLTKIVSYEEFGQSAAE
jgi:nitroreductase